MWIGPSSVGKTRLAIALGVRACQANYRVRFVRAHDLLTRLYAALAGDTLDQVLDDYQKADIMIVDELGNSPRRADQDFAGVFFELVARRYRHCSFVLTTNLGFAEWGSALGSSFKVTPALERLLDGAHVITFPPDAPSYRTQRTEGPGRLPAKRRAPSRSSRSSTKAKP
jgi:DNA replication protein DnaC